MDSLQRLRLPIPLPNPVFPGTGPPAKLHSWAVLHSPPVTQPLVAGQRAGKADAKSPDAPMEGKEGEDGGESSDEEGMVKEDEENPISISLGDGPFLVTGSEKHICLLVRRLGEERGPRPRLFSMWGLQGIRCVL